jgi:hypothetical protein
MNSQGRWRRLRFSLKSFFIFAAAVCLTFGWYASQVYRQRRAVTAIQELGGRCHYQGEEKFLSHYEPRNIALNTGLVWVTPPPRSWLRRTLGEDWFASVDMVTLAGASFTNIEFKRLQHPLESLPEMRRLALRSTAIDHLGLKPISTLKQLHDLNLYETRIHIDDQGLIELRQALPELGISY